MTERKFKPGDVVRFKGGKKNFVVEDYVCTDGPARVLVWSEDWYDRTPLPEVVLEAVTDGEPGASRARDAVPTWGGPVHHAR